MTDEMDPLPFSPGQRHRATELPNRSLNRIGMCVPQAGAMDIMRACPRIFAAPMHKLSDRHFRYLLRLICPHTHLYTEMTHAASVVRCSRVLDFSPAEKPLVLQLAGCDPRQLEQAASIAQQREFDEMNLNVGCPSRKADSGRFGVCMMKEPTLVQECLAAIVEAAPRCVVSVKTRIGVDANEGYDFLTEFVEKVMRAPCRRFVIHARKAWLKGVSPKQNRSRPPLRHALVADVKQAFPELQIVLNGGIPDLESAKQHLSVFGGVFDGVMLGRSVYGNPYLLSGVGQEIYGASCKTRARTRIAVAYGAYLEENLRKFSSLRCALSRLSGLFFGCPGSRAFRRALTYDTRSCISAQIESALQCTQA